MNRSKGTGIAIRAVTLVALLLGAGNGMLAIGAVAAGASTTAGTAAPSSAHHVEFHPTLADEAFAKQRGPGYAKALGAARQRAASLPRAALAVGPSKAWTALGPQPESNPNFSYGGPNSGRITGLALNPGGTIYAATAGGGVWSTTNGGTSWTTNTDAQPDIAMGSVAVDPSATNFVFAGTGEDNSCLDCFYGSGIMESSDGGATWTTSNPGGVFTGRDISTIVVLPGAASIGTTKVLAGTSSGLYVSTNGGTSWTAEAGTGWVSGNVTSVVVNALTPSPTIYAAVGNIGVEESTDNGSTWNTVVSFGGCAFPCFGALAIAPNASPSSTTLYLSLGSGAQYIGMSKSTDGGSTWNSVTVPLFTSDDYAYGSTGGGDQSWYDNAIAIDPTNPNIVVAAGITAVETTDGGSTWTNLNGKAFFAIGANQFHPDFHAVVFNGTGDLFVGNDGGVWKLPAADVNTTPPTTTWTNINGNLNVTQFYAGISQSANASQILGGAQDNGTDLYSAAGSPPTTWNEIDGGDGGFSVIDPSNPLIQYSEADISVGGTLDRTTDGWTSFANFTQNPPPPFGSANWAAPLVAIPGTAAGNGNGFSTILMGADYVYRSTDGAVSWTKLGSATSHTGSDISAVAVSPSNSSVIYAGFDDGTIQVSANGGATWAFLGSVPTGGLDVTHITVSASDPNTVYVSLASTFNGFPEQPSGPKVIVGTSLNTTPAWTDVSGNLPIGVPTNSVISDGATGLIVADDTGVYTAATLNGTSTVWSRVGIGFPNVQVMDVVLTSAGTLIADTHGRGVWSFPFSSVADGSGTLAVLPTSVAAGSTDGTLTFTYTAATAGLSSGEIDVAVPTGWSAPSTTGNAAGFTTSTCGTVGLSGRTITVTGVTIAGGTTCTITYGSKASGGAGATAPSTAGTSTFGTTEKSTAGGTLSPLATSPAVTLTNATDGTGTLVVAPTSVLAGSTGDTLTFTYTAATGGLSSGEIDVAVPAGWSPSSTTTSAAGFSTSTCGTVAAPGSSINVTGVTLTSGATCTITYGSKASSGPGASAPSSSGVSTFATTEKSTVSGTLTALAVSPTVTVGNSADGSGMLVVSPTSVLAGSTGDTVTFTYTAAAGGLSSGEIDVAIPAGWSASSTTTSAAGYSTSTCGTVAAPGSTINVTAVSLTSGATCTITYGSKASSGPGASAPASAGVSTFTTTEKSTSGGALTALATSPAVTVGNAANGTGTLVVSPTSVVAGSTGNTLTFTYTAAAGGLSSGEIDVAVPAGWSPSSTTTSAAGYTTSTCGTVAAPGSAINVPGVTLTSGGTCTITYGSKASSGPGASAPASAGVSTFTTTEKSTSGGALTALATSPTVTRTNAADGSGTLVVSPTSVLAGSTGNTLTFTYTAAAGGLASGEIDVAVPAGWSPSSTTSSAAGFSTSTCGTVAAPGSSINVTGVTLTSGATCTITYGSKASSGPGASAPTSAGTSTFTTTEKSTSSGVLTALVGSPAVTITNAADGTGTLVVSPTSVLAGSTGDTLTFTYTAAAGGLASGEIDMVVPDGWSASSTTTSAAGYTTSTCGTVTAPGTTITISGVTLTSGATCTITYGDQSNLGPGATAPASAGTSTFTTTEKSTASGGLTALAVLPTVTRTNAADGSGTLVVSPPSVVAGSTGDTLTFTYTAAAGGLASGEIDVVVPAGWSASSTTSGAPGFTTSTCGTVAAPGSTINVTGVTLASGAACTITYGSKASSGPGASAPSSSGVSTFATTEKSTVSGTLTALAVSPTVTVGNAADGTGTLVVSPTSVLAGSTGDTLTFTYTAAAGGLGSGEIDVVVPAGWSAPSTTGSAAGFTTSTCGTVAAPGSTISVTGVTLTSGGTCTITFGSKASSGPGASAPASAGTSTFTTTEKSTATGVLTALVGSPSVTVTNAADGTGTLGVSPPSVVAGSTGNTLTFTYTAAAGGLASGEIDMVVPAGWSAPSITGSSAGFTTSTCGTVGLSGSTLTVSGVTLASGATCTVAYGSKASGGPGATAPASAGTSTFTTTEKSTAAGVLTALAVSPSVTLTNAADGTGTLVVAPTSVLAGSTGDTLTFTYTAAAGGLSSGEIDVVVPAGWSAPSTTGNAAGFTTSTCGTVGASSGTIAVTGVTLTIGATCTITFGSQSNLGPGASAPASAGTSTFTTTEKSTVSGTLVALAVLPVVTLSNAADGTGTLTVLPVSVVAGSTGDTLTFTYTAGAGGLSSGEIDVTVPAGWSAPSTTGNALGFTTSTCGTVGVASGTITVTGVSLASGAACTITYGSKASSGPGASAPSSSGVSTFATTEKSTVSGTLTALAVSPTVTVGNAADGTGTLVVSPTSVLAGSTGDTLTFTYTAAAGGLGSGEIDVVVPAGWSAPSTTGSAAGFTTSTCGTVAAPGSTISVTGVTLTSGGTCTITFGSKASSGPGASAPASAGTSTFTTTEKSTATGVLTALVGSPSVTVTNAADGTGTLGVSPPSVVAGSTGNTLTFTYTAAAGGLASGEIDMVVPAGWSAPSITGSSAGFTTSTCGTVGLSGSTLTVSGVTLASGATCTVAYGSKASGGPGATAPASAGTSTFTTTEKSTAAGVLTALAVSPSVTLTNAADGTGTLVVAPTSVLAGSTGDTLTFTYTAAAGGLSSGEIDVVVPAGWSAPSTTGNAAGFTTSTCGTVGASSGTIAVTGVTLTIGATCTITFGSQSNLGPGASAPASAGTSTFTTTEKSTVSGTLVALAVLPVVTLSNAADGTGTLTVLPVSVVAGSTGDTLTFTYTAATGGTSNGGVDLVVPGGWSGPSIIGSNAGYTTSTCGTVGASGNTVTVTGVTLTSAATCTITYGSTASGGSGASAPSSSGISTFATTEKSTALGVLTAVATSPAVTVGNAADGTGTLQVSPTSVLAGSTGSTLTFTYTAAAGGLSSGQIDVTVPASWSAASTTGSVAGFTTSTCGTVGLSGSTLTVTGVTLSSGGTCTITYGSKASGGPGAGTPGNAGVSTFATTEKSTPGGSLTALADSPAVTLTSAADGTGTLQVSPTSALAGATGSTLTFTYTAAAGGLSSGQIDVTVPASWSAASTTGSAPGFSTSTCGTVGLSGSTLTMTGVTLTSGATCTITYGSKASGGPGATAPASAASSTFTTTEKSTAAGVLTALAVSPTVTLTNAADGTGTLQVSPTSALAGATGSTLTFTYTAATGGLSSGEIDVVIPAGWSASSTTPSAPGFATSTCGTVTAPGSAIDMTGVTLTSRATCTITYGSKASGGPGATAPSSARTSTFAATEKSTSGGTLTALATSPTVTVGLSPTSTSISVSPISVTSGHLVTFSARVTSGSGTPGGTVAFTTGSTALCTAPLSAGLGSCTATTAPVGTDTITGRYSGDAAHATSSGRATLTVTSATSPQGYWVAASNGRVFAFGNLAFRGPTGAMRLNAPIVGMASTVDGKGYWLVASDGGIFTFGDARFHGSLGAVHLNSPIVGIARTASGNGYWLVAGDGGIFTFGDAHFHGSLGAVHLNSPIVAMARTASGNGYWLVAGDGGIFTFGDARFHGSLGAVHLNSPIVGMASTVDGNGYWLVAGDGGIFTFGDARFHGSLGAVHLNSPIVGMVRTPSGNGYWLVAGDGGIFTFGDAAYLGSVPGLGVLIHNVVGIATP